MLSDVEGIQGGETEVCRGDGEDIKARGPELGSCVVMQGGSITLAALPCDITFKRITMITLFRPQRPTEEISNLRNIHKCSDTHEVYRQYLASPH